MSMTGTRFNNNYFWALFSISFLLFILVALLSNKAHALALDNSCPKVQLVFARGSGMSLGAENREGSRFNNELKRRIKKPYTYQYYELGTESYGGYAYPAVGVGVDSWAHVSNTLGAAITAGMGNEYGNSVKVGVNELKSYLGQRYRKCKSSGTYYILSGYSQGAQVIGQALLEISETIRDRIIFVGLFGDPKLYLPEGEGFWNPPACQGKNFSQYRRAIGDCHLSEGRLGARKDYLPNDMMTKTGLWCYKEDFICGTSPNPASKGHETYANKGMAVDAAAKEAAARLLDVIKSEPPVTQTPGSVTPPQPTPEEAEQLIDTKFTFGMGMNGQDVLYVVDRTYNMASRIPALRQHIMATSSKIMAEGGRFALVTYCSIQTAPNFTVTQPYYISFDVVASGVLNQYLNLITEPCPGTNQSDELYVLYTAVAGLKWRYGAAKSLVWFTNSAHPIQNPSPLFPHITTDLLAKLTLQIDPVNIYPVVPEESVPFYQGLADITSGQITTDSGDITAAAESAYSKIESRPVTLLKNTEYSASAGEEVTFDASDSYTVDSTITKYDWDFNGDNIFEESTSTPITNHVYDQEFEGYMQVRVTTANGAVGNASAPVKISNYAAEPTLPSAPTNLNVTILATNDEKSTVRLDWTLPDDLPANWILTLNGVPLGLMNPDQTSVEITDVDRSFDADFGIAGVTPDQMVGGGVFATIKGPTPVIEEVDDNEDVVLHPDTESTSKDTEQTIRYASQNLDDGTHVVLGIQDVIYGSDFQNGGMIQSNYASQRSSNVSIMNWSWPLALFLTAGVLAGIWLYGQWRKSS